MSENCCQRSSFCLDRRKIELPMESVQLLLKLIWFDENVNGVIKLWMLKWSGFRTLTRMSDYNKYYETSLHDQTLMTMLWEFAMITVNIWLHKGSYLRIIRLPVVWSPERKRSFPPGELRRLLMPSKGLWFPCGPQLLPAVVVANKELVHPSVSVVSME